MSHITTVFFCFVFLDPLQPGQLIECNKSPDNLYLKWERCSTSFVNRYKVTIDNKTQYTLGNESEIHWNYLLMPEHPYIVMITAVSYGYTTNFPTYGSKESTTSIINIRTKECK